MQYKIPQNVRIEDKIVGPLTLKQLIVIGVGGGITYAIYIFMAKRYFIEVWLPSILPTTILTLCFAFVTINGVPFGKWILLMVEYLKNPRKRMFQMGAADYYGNVNVAKKDVAASEEVILDKQNRLKQISSITKLVDTHPAPRL